MSTLKKAYKKFLKNKIKVAQSRGFEVDRTLFHPSFKPHQTDICEWACEKGAALIAASFGLGKTRMDIQILLEVKRKHPDAPVLVVCPLGVRQEFMHNDGPVMGVTFEYIRNREEQHNATTDFHITNYERVRDGDLDLSIYQCVCLDEGSCLRSLGSDTTQQFINKFKGTAYKYVFTATPSPNEYLELLNYAEFLGVMDRGQALTRFFKRNSQKAGELTIMPNQEEEFWLWVSSWAIFIEKPSDLGYEDEGYELPDINIEYHQVKVDNDKFGVITERDGQIKAFADTAKSLQDTAKVKRVSLDERLSKTIELTTEGGEGKHWIIWHHLEDERKAIEMAYGVMQHRSFASVYGSQDLDKREQAIIDFSEGKIEILATKPEIAGSGCNFQHHCADAIFMGVDYKFNDFIQAVHRIYRFLQTKQVNIHIIYCAEEQPIIDSLKEKWQLHTEQRGKMRDIIGEFGLAHRGTIGKLSRSFGCERIEVKGESFTAINNDNVLELDLDTIPDNSVGLIHSSIPFGNHFEYSASYNDFGHNENNNLFWKQMDFLIPNLFRVLEPGRNAIIHVKDRIQYATITGDGAYTMLPFSDECTAAFRKHGFLLMAGGRIQIDTDVVRENNQTYRLTHGEKCKDGSKMGAGLPEYLLVFRKPQTDMSRGYADKPICKSKDEFNLAIWQILAGSNWRSSGNRLLTPAEIATWNSDKIYKWFKMWSAAEVYDFRFHVELGEELLKRNKLPKSYSLLAPASNTENRWANINRMNCLNAQQMKRKLENHVCPLQFDIVERVIENWSMKGDVVLDPFGGLMTVPLMAVRMGRKGIGIELNNEYFGMGVKYLQEEQYKATIPTLFDELIELKELPESTQAIAV